MKWIEQQVSNGTITTLQAAALFAQLAPFYCENNIKGSKNSLFIEASKVCCLLLDHYRFDQIVDVDNAFSLFLSFSIKMDRSYHRYRWYPEGDIPRRFNQSQANLTKCKQAIQQQKLSKLHLTKVFTALMENKETKTFIYKDEDFMFLFLTHCQFVVLWDKMETVLSDCFFTCLDNSNMSKRQNWLLNTFIAKILPAKQVALLCKKVLKASESQMNLSHITRIILPWSWKKQNVQNFANKFMALVFKLGDIDVLLGNSDKTFVKDLITIWMYMKGGKYQELLVSKLNQSSLCTKQNETVGFAMLDAFVDGTNQVIDTCVEMQQPMVEWMNNATGCQLICQKNLSKRIRKEHSKPMSM